MRNRLHLFAASLLGIICVVLLALTMVRHVGATKTNFDRIENGMTKEQVENILGPPIRDHRKEAGWIAPHGEGWDRSDGSFIFVGFEDGVVTKKEWGKVDMQGRSVSWSARLRRWLGLQ